MAYINQGQRKYDDVRAAAVEAMILIEQGETLDNASRMVTAKREFRPIDRRFFLQLVNGSTKLRRRLDHEIKFYLSKPSVELPLKLKNILRLGMFQLRFTDRIPDSAAVSESVNLAHYMIGKPQANLVNAVLRSTIREPHKVRFADNKENPVKYLGDFYSYPDFFVDYCLKEFGYEKTESLLISYNKPPKVTYRVNFLNAKPDEVANILQENDVEFSFGKYLPEFIHIEQGGLPLEDELITTGKVYVQDESSGMPVRLLNPRPGNSMIDLAAAPGGKSTYAAIRMRNRGKVVALDKSMKRLEVLVGNARRLNISIISPVVTDMFDFSNDLFDRVLLDPPCTGWGSAGKHSDLRWAKSANDIIKLKKIQSGMLGRSAKLVKPGGVLVYSTCSIIRDENDQIIEEFLLRHKNFEIESADAYFPEELVSDRGFMKSYPSFDNLDGAFAARLKRKMD